jgi:hypothetical protein
MLSLGFNWRRASKRKFVRPVVVCETGSDNSDFQAVSVRSESVSRNQRFRRKGSGGFYEFKDIGVRKPSVDSLRYQRQKFAIVERVLRVERIL